MRKGTFTRKIVLDAVEISDISVSLRQSLNNAIEELKNAKGEDRKSIEEYIIRTQKLQKKFQRLAVTIEKEVLRSI